MGVEELVDENYAVLEGTVKEITQIVREYGDSDLIGVMVTSKVEIPKQVLSDEVIYKSVNVTFPLTMDQRPWPGVGDTLTVRVDW